VDCATIFDEGSGGEKYDGGVGVSSRSYMFRDGDLKESFLAVE